MDVVALPQPALYAGVGSAFGAAITYLVSHPSFNTLQVPLYSASVDAEDVDIVQPSSGCPARFQLNLDLSPDYNLLVGSGLGALVVISYLWLRRFLRLVELVESGCLRLFGGRASITPSARPTLVRPASLPRESSAFLGFKHG